MDSGDVCSAGELSGRAGEWVVIAGQGRGKGGRKEGKLGGGREMETGVETDGDGGRTRSRAGSGEQARRRRQGRGAGRRSARIARRLKKRAGRGEESFRLRQTTRQTQCRPQAARVTQQAHKSQKNLDANHLTCRLHVSPFHQIMPSSLMIWQLILTVSPAIHRCNSAKFTQRHAAVHVGTPTFQVVIGPVPLRHAPSAPIRHRHPAPHVRADHLRCRAERRQAADPAAAAGAAAREPDADAGRQVVCKVRAQAVLHAVDVGAALHRKGHGPLPRGHDDRVPDAQPQGVVVVTRATLYVNVVFIVYIHSLARRVTYRKQRPSIHTLVR